MDNEKQEIGMKLQELLRYPFMIMAALLLAACTGSGQVNQALSPDQTTSQNQQAGSESAPAVRENALAAEEPATPAETVTSAQTASLATGNAMTFLPVEGAPQGKVTELSKSIRLAAQTHELSVLPATQSGAKYQVKGYFSALNDGSGTLLIYIWDIFDGSGKRLHRINGQERTSTTKTNPWNAISEKELARVADATAQRLKTWVETN